MRKGDMLAGRYLIDGLLERGPGCLSYRGRPAWADELVIIIEAPTELACAPTVANVHHDGLIGALECFELDDHAYVVMRHVQGPSLQQMVEEKGTPPLTEVKRWMLQLCDVLAYLHQQTPPIVLGGLQPSGVVIDAERKAWLVDPRILALLDGHAPTDLPSDPGQDIRSLAALLQFALGETEPPAPVQALLERLQADSFASMAEVGEAMHQIGWGELSPQPDLPQSRVAPQVAEVAEAAEVAAPAGPPSLPLGTSRRHAPLPPAAAPASSSTRRSLMLAAGAVIVCVLLSFLRPAVQSPLTVPSPSAVLTPALRPMAAPSPPAPVRVPTAVVPTPDEVAPAPSPPPHVPVPTVEVPTPPQEVAPSPSPPAPVHVPAAVTRTPPPLSHTSPQPAPSAESLRHKQYRVPVSRPRPRRPRPAPTAY